MHTWNCRRQDSPLPPASEDALRVHPYRELGVLLESGQEENPVLEQFLYVLLGQVPCIKDCKLYVYAIGLQLQGGLRQCGDVIDVLCAVAEDC